MWGYANYIVINSIVSLILSRTKQVVRYRSPEVDTCVKELNRLREHLVADCHAAWLCFVTEFNAHYFAHKKAIKNIAILDVLFSLVEVAKQESYCKYVF